MAHNGEIHDYSSDNFSINVDNYDNQYFPLILQLSNEAFIVSSDTLPTFIDDPDDSIFSFKSHLNSIDNMELDHAAYFHSATKVSTSNQHLSHYKNGELDKASVVGTIRHYKRVLQPQPSSSSCLEMHQCHSANIVSKHWSYQNVLQ